MQPVGLATNVALNRWELGDGVGGARDLRRALHREQTTRAGCTARKPERQRRAGRRPRAALERAAHQPRPLAQQTEADVPPALGVDLVRVEARALVRDACDDPLLVNTELGACVVDIGVLDD